MGTARRIDRPSPKPTVSRCFVAAAAVTLLFAAAGRAQEAEAAATLTEREAVSRALERAPLTELIEGQVAIEQGRGQTQSAYPTPQLSYTREQTYGAFGTGEDYLSVAQIIDLGNRRGLLGRAGRARAHAAQQEGDASRLLLAAEARLRFYELLYRQGRVAAFAGWGTRIDEALAIVTRREQRGDAATYDRRRLERERAVARGRLETERGALERADGRLRAILGLHASGANLRATGTLLPEDDPPALASLHVASRARPDLLALDLQIQAASLEQTAAARWWVPDLRLEGGWKGIDLGRQGRTDGFLLGASLSIPLWNQASGLARSAEGEARAARGRRSLVASELAGELGGTRSEAVRLRRAAAEFREQSTAASSELLRIAAAGYQGGELGLLELLDAYRGAADDSLTALDMEHAARRARIELDRLTQAGLP